MTDSVEAESSAEALLAAKTRALRIARGWSQEDVAERMKAAGYNWFQSTAAKTEAGDRPIRLNEAAELARIFDADLGNLIRPRVRPLNARIQHELALSKLLQADAATKEEVYNKAVKLMRSASARAAALTRLATFMEKPRPDRNLFVKAMVGLVQGFPDEEWKDVLTEAGFVRDALDLIIARAQDASAEELLQSGGEVEMEKYGHLIAHRLFDAITVSNGEH